MPKSENPKSSDFPNSSPYQPKISASDMLDILRGRGQASGLSEREKRALVAKSARLLLGELATPTDVVEQKIMNATISLIVREILTDTTRKTRSLANQIWELSGAESDACHAVNVATLSVLFSMAFGHIDETLLRDIGLAALVHDVGVTQLPYSLLQKPESERNEADQKVFDGHVPLTIQLIDDFAPDFPTRVRAFIEQHHEPKGEIPQMIAMADALDSWCRGRQDGAEKTVLEALIFLELSEAETTRKLNPDRLSAVLRWIREAA